MKHLPGQFIFWVAFLFVLTPANGQASDTTSNTPKTWDRFQIGLRAGGGIQKSFFTEVGLSLQKYVYAERHGYMATTFYTSFEWTPSSSRGKPVYGFKAGAELVNNGATGGFEVKYLVNAENKDVMLTPKYGFGLGFVTVFYGYNISTNKYPFHQIGKHQFSLVINSNIFFYYKRNKD